MISSTHAPGGARKTKGNWRTFTAPAALASFPLGNVMTPEELKQYVEHRLSERGCSVHLGKSGFERMFRFTEGTEDGMRALCHKLASLGAVQRDHKIDDALLEVAISDIARGDGIAARAAAAGADFGGADLASIDQLAAVLEARVADGAPE